MLENRLEDSGIDYKIRGNRFLVKVPDNIEGVHYNDDYIDFKKDTIIDGQHWFQISQQLLQNIVDPERETSRIASTTIADEPSDQLIESDNDNLEPPEASEQS